MLSLALIVNVSAQKSDPFNEGTCPSQNSPRQSSSDYFKIWYAQDNYGIKAKMSAPTAIALHDYYGEHSYAENQRYMINLFKGMRQVNEGYLGLGSVTVTDKDYEKLAELVHDGFEYFHDKVMSFLRGKLSMTSDNIYLHTGRETSWKEDYAELMIGTSESDSESYDVYDHDQEPDLGE